MLAGLAVVGAAQDAIDGFALTAGGRLLELMLQTLGVVLGIVVGLELARALGVGMQPPTEALPLGSLGGARNSRVAAVALRRRRAPLRGRQW